MDTKFLLKHLAPEHVQKHGGNIEKAMDELNDYPFKIDNIKKLGAELIWQVDGMQNDHYVAELATRFVDLVREIPNNSLKLLNETFFNLEKTEGYVRRFCYADSIFSRLKEKDPEYFSFAHIEDQPDSTYEWIELQNSKVIKK